MWMTSLTQAAQNAHPNTLMLVVEDFSALLSSNYSMLTRFLPRFENG